MRVLRTCTLFLATLLPLAAEDWVTADGKTYKNITVLGQQDDGVRISYDGGVGKVPYYELPVDVQKRFSQDIDSLAAKRKAIDQAIEAAVKNAADAQILTQSPASAAPVATPAPVRPAASSAPVATGNAAPATDATPIPSAGTAPAATPGATPTEATAASVPTPGQPAPAGAAALPAQPTTAAAAATTPPPSPPTNAAAAATPAVAASSAETGGPAKAGGVHPVAVPGFGKYPGGSLTFNNALDVCYLDSPTVELTPEHPRLKKNPNAGCSLMFRVVTDGPLPQRPDRLEATFLSVGDAGRYAGMHEVAFSIDGDPMLIDDSASKDSGTLSGAGQAVEYISFYLTPEQALRIEKAAKVGFNASPDKFTVGEAGAARLQEYLQMVDGLPPRQSSLLRSAYKALARIPSIFTYLSVICEYVILGSFALLVMAMIAAFVLGVTRFIKM